MTDRLFIRFHFEEESEVTWLRQGAIPGKAIPQTGPLSDLSGQAADCQVIVFAPGSDETLLMADIPPMSRQRMLTAIPFALEDHLVANIDSLHFAFSPQLDNGLIPVAVVADDRISGWLSRLQQAGIHPDSLIPETLALPLAPDSWTILIDVDGGLVRSGVLSGFAVDLPNLALIVRDALDREGDPLRRIRLLHHGGPSVMAGNTPLLECAGCEITEESYNADRLQILGAHFDEQRAINLLQGKYKRETGIDQIWRAWKIPFALLVILLLVWIAGALLDITRLSDQSRELNSRIQEAYRQVFPDARNMSNLRVRMERSLDELRKANPKENIGFLPLLGRVGAHLPAARNTQLTSIRFHSGELELRMEIADLQAFDGIKGQLIRSGLTVEVLSVTTRQNTVMAHLKIGLRE